MIWKMWRDLEKRKEEECDLIQFKRNFREKEILKGNI